MQATSNFSSAAEIYSQLQALYKYSFLKTPYHSASFTSSLAKQLHRYLNFYHKPSSYHHSILPGQRPIHFKLDKISLYSNYLTSIRDYLLKLYKTKSYSSSRDFSVGLSDDLILLLNKELNKILVSNKWLPHGCTFIRSAAFKMQASDLHHGNAENYHLDNDPEFIKAIIFPFDRHEHDGCFTYRSTNLAHYDYYPIIFPHLQRNPKELLSYGLTSLSPSQYDLYSIVSHSSTFLSSNILDLLSSSKQLVRHEMYSGVIFKGDTTFHRGGGVTTTPRFSIQLLLEIQPYG